MRKFICAFITILTLVCPVYASYDINSRVIDNAGLFSAEQSSDLKSRINNLIDQYNFDIVILTLNDLEGKGPRAYADDYFDYNGYGFGPNRDGVLFLISMKDRDWYISASGSGRQVINDARVKAIGNSVFPNLNHEDYYGAFSVFLKMTEGYLKDPNPESGNKVKNILIVWIAAFVIALAAVLVMRSQLKTARPKQLAHDYVVQGSFHLTHKRDFFINTHTTRTPRPKDTGSGGNTSTHTSSSGRTHSGGGGKF